MSVRPDAEKSVNLYYAAFLEDFGSIPPELEKKLFEESDATVLKNWLKIAATSKKYRRIYTKNPVILYWTVKLSYAFGYYSGTSPIFKSMSQRNLCLIRQYLSKKMQRNSIVFNNKVYKHSFRNARTLFFLQPFCNLSRYIHTTR